MSYDLEEIRQQRGAARAVRQVEEVLEFAAKKGVTLVQLEKLAKDWLPRNEEVAAKRQAITRKVNHHKRALNANRARWRKAKKFLEGHVDADTRIAEKIKAVGSMASLLQGEPLPRPEPELVPPKELFS